MEIQIANQHPMKGMDPGGIKRRLRKILKGLACLNVELSVLLTDDAHIAELNRRFLNREGPTNVLAFPMREGNGDEFETTMLGDIVISLDAAQRDAKQSGESFDKTIDRLLIHGLLHLLGYEHERSKAEARHMGDETERLLAMIE
jgi:probable rRNA maturation factor